MENTLPTPVEYMVLNGPDFEDALSGRWEEGVVTQPWLSSPRLHYYMRRPALMQGPDQRVFFLALTPPQYDESMGRELKRAIGIIELQVSPYDDREVWLKYITVDPQYRLKGVCTKLLNMMVPYLLANPRLLARSRPGEHAPAALTGFIDRLLDGAGIQWKQSGREEKSLAAAC